jgi:carbonic anhydrase/acetyltransferase-like protein (isoleucine patch superfamily)
VRAFGEIGLRRAGRYVWTTILLAIFGLVPFPPLRSIFLRLCGATVGTDTILHRFTMINVDRGGFGALRIGRSCFVGQEVLVDLAAFVVLEDHVTLAARAMLLTHLNVGYQDHPLMARFPSETAGVTISRGSFVGAAAIVLPGCTIGPEAFVAAAALVNRDVEPGEVVAGVPIRQIGRGKRD